MVVNNLWSIHWRRSIVSNVTCFTAYEKIVPNKLSLGQKQLLAGVRACYLKKNIVFFDEISSALDSELEYALR